MPETLERLVSHVRAPPDCIRGEAALDLWQELNRIEAGLRGMAARQGIAWPPDDDDEEDSL